MASSLGNDPVVVARFPTEPLASLALARLRSEGIAAEMIGALTSAFRADVPGDVQILVRSADAVKAREILAQVKRDR